MKRRKEDFNNPTADIPNGSYQQYYSYRNQDDRIDRCDDSLFTGKRVLDVGCNAGMVSLQVANKNPSYLLGIDVSPGFGDYVASSSRSYQPYRDLIAKADASNTSTCCVFRVMDIMNDRLWTGEEKFDTIICFSLSKWVHLNHGDAGIKRLFARLNALLAPGGCLLLEPQPWKSYKKNRFASPQTRQMYSRIKLKPRAFPRILLLDYEFAKCQVLKVPKGQKGFDARPLFAFFKGGVEAE